MKVSKQEVTDWTNHPLTKNFVGGVNDNIDHFKRVLGNPEVDLTELETVKKKGIILGLEALLTYEPEIDKDGDLVEYE